MDLRQYAEAFSEAERDFEKSVESFGLPFESLESSPRDARISTARRCNCACEQYAEAFSEAERDFEKSVESFGLPFESLESSPRDARISTARRCNCACENADSSLRRGWISPACLACRTGERTATFFVDLRCTKHWTARRCNCACENADSSLRRGWISPACLACRTGERTATFFVDLRCTKHCYFCFNPNQDGYEYFLTHKRDIVAELEQAHAHGVSFDCLAITGGEPMLHKPMVSAFLRRARELYPQVHIRLYTSGDLLDEASLRELSEAGLDEIRFSVKPADVDRRARELYPQVHIRLYTSGDLLDEASLRELSEAGLDEIRFSVKPADVEAEQGGVYALMEQAVALIPDVVIEVPVIPGSLEGMKGMMRRASAIGVRGINLLEFCFPLCNADEFAKRGFELRKHPYAYLYNYWYGGGIPVAGVRGINLLEFCFPLCNADEFAKRGFELRKHPYAYLYNYWYGGGIPVAGSETEALALMDFACGENLPIGVHYCSSDNKNTGQIFQQNKPFGLDVALRARYPWLSQDPEDGENLPIGVHYCSSDNKNTGQIFQQNKPFGLDVALRARYPWLSQDPEDHFLKCAKAFGEDALAALDKLEHSGEHRTELDALNLVASFPLEKAPAVREALPHAELAVSVNVLEEAEDGGVRLREVAVEPFA